MSVKVERIRVEPVVPPPDTIKIELSLLEAQDLELLLSTLAGDPPVRQGLQQPTYRLYTVLGKDKWNTSLRVAGARVGIAGDAEDPRPWTSRVGA
jgi:hypothetical protein